MAAPMFSVIPVIQSRSGVYIGAVMISGISTKADGKTDNGRLYATLSTLPSGRYRVDLYSDYPRTALVGRADEAAVDGYAAIVPQNDSGIGGQIRLSGSGAPASDARIVIVSFAVDADVFKTAGYAQQMPGYDADYGLAHFHAQAMRRILTSDLPATVPNLYVGKKVSAFVPLSGVEQLPELTEIASPESLRQAQAFLVKMLSAQEGEHMEEFAEMKEAASDDYDTLMGQFSKANAPAEEVAEEAAASIQFGSWRRG